MGDRSVDDALVPSRAGEPRRLALGHTHGCYVDPAGTLWCWGDRRFGQVGDGKVEYASTPVSLSSDIVFVEVVAGSDHSCALTKDGAVYCWGRNRYGQLGDGSRDTLIRLLPEPILTGAVQIAAGESHSCARLEDGSARCWGLNHESQLGDGSFALHLEPTKVKGLSDLVDLGAAGAMSYARHRDGTLWAWGNVDWNVPDALKYDSYGTPLPTPYDVAPRKLEDFPNLVEIRSGSSRALMLTDDGIVRGWGFLRGHAPRPVQVGGFRGAREVATGDNHGCARLMDQTVVCWGSNAFGQLGIGAGLDSELATPVSELANIIALAAAADHTCVILRRAEKGEDTEEVHCWGLNHLGQLGDGTSTTRQRPRRIH